VAAWCAAPSAVTLARRTVGYHLYKAFSKLGVTTREKLAHYAP